MISSPDRFRDRDEGHRKSAGGRAVEATAAVNIDKKGGDSLSNAYMILDTKAFRRAVLRITGAGMLDATEVDSIPPSQAARVTVDTETGEIIDGKAKSLPARTGAPNADTWVDCPTCDDGRRKSGFKQCFNCNKDGVPMPGTEEQEAPPPPPNSNSFQSGRPTR